MTTSPFSTGPRRTRRDCVWPNACATSARPPPRRLTPSDSVVGWESAPRLTSAPRLLRCRFGNQTPKLPLAPASKSR